MCGRAVYCFIEGHEHCAKFGDDRTSFNVIYDVCDV